MFDTWGAFVGKLALFSSDVATKQHSIDTAEISKYVNELESELTT